MDVLYIPQLDEIGTGGGGDSGGEGGGGSGGTAARYRILRRVPEDGVVVLTDRAVTRVDIATDGGPLRLVVPPEAKGTARDFFVRLVITADEIPEVTFAAPAGETISFEDVDDDVFKCETGVNVFAFTELDNGIFIVNRKMVDIDQEVEFVDRLIDQDAAALGRDLAAPVFRTVVLFVPVPGDQRPGVVYAAALTDQFFDFERRGVETVLEADADNSGALALGFKQTVDLFVGDTDRLFQKDVDPAGKRLARHLKMQMVRRRDMYRVGFDRVEHLPVVGKDARVRRVLVPRAFGAFGENIAQTRDLDVRDLPERGQVVAGDRSATDQNSLHRFSPTLF